MVSTYGIACNSTYRYMKHLRHIINSIPLKEFSIHIAVLVLVYYIFYFTGFFQYMPDDTLISAWDVSWMKKIADKGYEYTPGEQCSVAFYPLFPYMWKLLDVTPIGISIINFLFMLAGFSLLFNAFNIKGRILLLLLSAPSLFFCYVPYTEALFFFSSSLLLYGLHRNNLAWAVVGIFLACLSRSVGSLFGPVLVFMFICNYNRQHIKQHLTTISALLFASLLSLGLVQFIQWWQTGQWFKSYEVQKYWHREFRMPQFFLSTWGDERLVWIDGLAFFVCVLAIGTGLVLLWRKFKSVNKTVNPAFLFSMGYLGMIALTVLFYSPVSDSGSTSIYSANRYVFATPFFTVFLFMLFQHIKVNFKNAFILLLLIDFVGFLFGFFRGQSGLIYFSVLGLYCYLCYLMLHKKVRAEVWSALYLLNIILQLYLFNLFINAIWVG